MFSECDEYSREFLDDTIEVPRPGGWSPLGKVPASFGEFPHAVSAFGEGLVVLLLLLFFRRIWGLKLTMKFSGRVVEV